MLRLYAALMRVSMLGEIQYRASAIIWMVGLILEPVIYLVVWSSIARSLGGRVGGYDAGDFAAYYLVFLFMTHMTFSWVMEVFQHRIQQGQLSFELLRPIHPIHADVTENLAYKLHMLLVLLPATGVLVLVFEPHFTFVPWSVALAVPALALGFALRFLIEWTVALSAFWTTRTSAVNRMYYSVQLFLSGRAAPIALLPLGLGDVARVLPFYSMVGFPTELALGRLPLERALEGIALQLAWVGATGLVLALVWRIAVRRYAAVGQ